MSALLETIQHTQHIQHYGRIQSVVGLMVEAEGINRYVSIGSRVIIKADNSKKVMAEVVGFRGEITLIMPYDSLSGLHPGCPVLTTSESLSLYPTENWLGRVINGVGQPVDDGPPLPLGNHEYSLHAQPPSAHSRARVGHRIDVKMRAINTFTTLCQGQRMGIFAGSGVGKSVLLSQLARFTECDVAVIGLIGERGREVQEFLQDHLGEEGLRRSVVVVATSDESALMRRQAAYTTLTLAEYFRDQGKTVLCLMDSVTRFAMAQREIGLSVGEPPTAKGYPPTVFAELPRLLERAGPGTPNQGTITGIFTVLVDGDDHNEPIADATRGILDGHLVLERSIAERGRFPAINVLKSISRTMPDCNYDDETAIINAAKETLATYEDMAEMIRLGAYRKGSDPKVDKAIELYQPLMNFLKQGKHERASMDNAFAELASIMGMPPPQGT